MKDLFVMSESCRYIFATEIKVEIKSGNDFFLILLVVLVHTYVKGVTICTNLYLKKDNQSLYIN